MEIRQGRLKQPSVHGERFSQGNLGLRGGGMAKARRREPADIWTTLARRLHVYRRIRNSNRLNPWRLDKRTSVRRPSNFTGAKTVPLRGAGSVKFSHSADRSVTLSGSPSPRAPV